MNRYDFIMFDMDGTIMDSRDFHRDVLHRFFNKYVGPVSKEDVESGMGATVWDIFRFFDIDQSRWEPLFYNLEEFYQSQVDDLAQNMQVADGIYATLDGLKKQGIGIGLITNSVEVLARRMLYIHGMEHSFDIVSGADYNSVDKIERCRLIQEQTNATKILYVGDAENDIEMANRLGYDSCFVRTEIAWYKDEAYIEHELRPTYTIEAMTELLRLC